MELTATICYNGRPHALAAFVGSNDEPEATPPLLSVKISHRSNGGVKRVARSLGGGPHTLGARAPGRQPPVIN